MDEQQKEFVKNNANKMYRKNIAEKIMVSESTLKRFASENGIKFTYYSKADLYPKELIDEVIGYWLVNGVLAAKKKYPNVKIRSITEKYNKGQHYLSRYTFEDRLFLLRYSEFIGMTKAVNLLGRPIKKGNHTKLFSFEKRKKTPYRNHLNGLSKHTIKKYLLDPKFIELNYHKRKIITWTEIAKDLKVDNQNLLILAQAMAKFQTWIHGGSIITDEELICKKFQK